MPLPILHTTHEPTRADLIRYFHRAELHWARHLGEETVLDIGTAIVNSELGRVIEANTILDATLPGDMSPEQAVALVDEHYRAAGSRCRAWVMNPSSPPERNAPLVQHLLDHGHTRDSVDIHYLAGLPRTPISEVGSLTIIPARASYRHARALAEEAANNWSEPQLADAALLHLDDPHTDALIALKGGIPAAFVNVLSVGELGEIAELFVSAPFRGQGIGRTMMSRALEICARSLFKHVFLSVRPENAPAIALYAKAGFVRIGEIVSYRVVK